MTTTFSVVTPVCDPAPAELTELWASIRAQTRGSWQWCVCDDASTDPQVRALLDEIGRHPQVRSTRHDDRQGITAATVAAVALADGTHLAFVDHDDRLHPDALADVAAAIDADPEADVLYTDEDVLAPDGSRVAPSYKPAWSPERLRSQMYVGHLTVVRRGAYDAVGGLRPGFDGSQDYDLVLRLAEHTDRFVKVPGPRYHWRATERSVAGDAHAKPYAYDAAVRALQEHCERVGIAATVTPLDPPGRYAVLRTPAVASLAVICDPADGQRLEQWASATSGEGLVLEVVAATDRNRGAARAGADVLVFVAPGAELPGDREGWRHVAGLAAEPGVGVVGLANRTADGAVVDAGVVLTADGPVPLLADFPHDADHNRGDLAVARETGAVSGYGLAIATARFAELGGFCPTMGRHEAALDLCCKARLRGHRVVWTPRPALLLPDQARWERPLSGGVGARFAERWLPWLSVDPYYTADVRLGRAHYVAGVGFPD